MGSRIDIRYLAGLFDGEGSVSIRVSQGYASCRLQLSMTAKRPVFALSHAFGGSLHKVKEPTQGGLTEWHWTLSSHKAIRQLLQRLLPYLQVKHRQAKLAIAFCKRMEKGSQGRPVSMKEHAIRRQYAMQCRRLNGTL